jgi:hypothetical protein
MQLVKTTVRYYTNEEDTNTRSGQMDNQIMSKSCKDKKCKQKLLTNFNEFNKKFKEFNKKINHSIIW